ncbi:Basic secretory protease (Fragments) [Linum perenne]
MVLLSLMTTTAAVDYSVTNTAAATPGGSRFNNQIGAKYSRQTLSASTNFIQTTFRQNDPATRKPVQQVSLFIDDMDGVAYASNGEIHVSARYINGYTGDLRREFTGVMYHEMTHVWQWNGNGRAPGGLIEGIADFVRLKADLAPSHWVGPGKGDRWDQGYDVTARFLDYCEGLRSGFVAELNKKMRYGYNDGFFRELTGKSVDQLWRDYKANYTTTLTSAITISTSSRGNQRSIPSTTTTRPSNGWLDLSRAPTVSASSPHFSISSLRIHAGISGLAAMTAATLEPHHLEKRDRFYQDTGRKSAVGQIRVSSLRNAYDPTCGDAFRFEGSAQSIPIS